MAEDEDRPEDEIEDEDDSDLFEPPNADPLGDALADAAAGDMAGDMAGGEEDGEAEEQEEDDSDLFAPPADEADEPETEADEPEAEAPALGGHQPVLPVTVDETGAREEYQDDAQDHAQDEDADLFGAPGDEEEDQDGDPAEAAAGDPDEDEESSGEARQRYPWLQRSDEPEEPEEEEHSLQGRTLIFVGAGVVFVIFAALIWFLYSTGDEPPRDQDVALIEAPEGPAKVVPEDRGGMEVPDQDKLVFDRVSGQETQLEENLLAGPEEPVGLPDSAPESLDELVDALIDDGETVATREASAGSPEEEPAAAVEAAPVETVPAKSTAVETAPPPATPAGGTHVVQLGSYGSLERAGTAWRVVKNRHSIILAGLDNDIQRADLGARGVFYRLRTEPLGPGEARDLCADLKAAGQDCLVVRR